MSGVMDYGWDTSDEEGGMEIDLNPKASPKQAAAPAVTSKEEPEEDYDPCEPTDDYDPSEPTKDSQPEGKGPGESAKTEENNLQEVSDYDPEEPTLSDEEAGVEEGAKEKAEDGDRLNLEEEEEDGGDGRWNSQVVPSDEEEEEEVSGVAGSSQDVVESSTSQDNVENSQENELLDESRDLSLATSPNPRGAVTPTDTDDNTQTSVAEIPDDNFSDVPEVTFDESDFVLEKESFEEEGLSRPPEPENESNFQVGDPTVSEERERTRRQEEIDSRNEEALVDVFREESDPERINEETEQPTKKTKKKVGSKKLKKKGKKLKKGQGKKGSKGQDGTGAGDQRFVEIRRERQSVESWEEGEVEGEGEGGYRRKVYEDRVPLELAERSYESMPGTQDSDEQREPGEIVEMEGGKKRSTKKREKKEKKKKKSRREVATIEDGAGEDDSQKFPSFLAGFFVQDEDVDENVEAETEHFAQEEEHHFTKGTEKNYRKRHDSGAEDSVKSFEHNTAVLETREVRVEEVDHRRGGRRHEERRRESRERRHESRDTREVRRDRDVRHGASRERDRERERGRGERERLREKERERERARRSDMEERSDRRRHRSHSRSPERRRRSRSRDRSSRHHRNRSRSRDRSFERERRRDRERDKERERSKRRHRDRSREREMERRVRRMSPSRSRSPHRRSERASSNKENRDESSRGGRRRHEEPEDSENENTHYRHHHHRSNRHRRAPSTSSSSSSSSSESNLRHHRHHHHLDESHFAHSDDGASSDVILVEPERIVINLDDEEDPPSRVDITHANADNSTTLVDGESIPPPPELSGNARSSALIEINPNDSEEDGDATPTRDEPSDIVTPQQAAPTEGDYDPAHPTEEEEREQADIELSPKESSTAAPLPSDKGPGPMPPPLPPPEEVHRPSPPPPESQATTGQRPPLPMSQRPGVLQPPPLPPQQPGVLPFQPGTSAAGQPQRFPWPAGSSGPGNLMNQGPPRQPMIPPQANGPSPFHPQARGGGGGLLPTPDTRPLFAPGDGAPSRPNLPFAPTGGAASMGKDMPPPPISSMAPLAQLTSLLPALERAKLAAQQGSLPPPQLAAFKVPGQAKGPLTSTSNNMPGRGGRAGLRGGDFSESTEVVDMDMSPGEDDCELELPSPPDSDGDGRGRRRGRRGDHQQGKAASVAAGKGGPAQAAYLKALSKMIEKLTPKGQQQQGGHPGSSAAGQDRARHSHRGKRLAPKVDLNDDDVPASAVDLTNKEKFMKKLHLQERVIDEVKLAIKPFYASKKITKEQYKLIMKKAVPKICHCKSGNINPQKIQQLVEAYVSKMQANKQKGKKKKGGHLKDSAAKEQKDTPPVRQNGEQRPKKMAR